MSDNDLIRRGDALGAVQEWTYCCDAEAAINAIPAVQPTVSPDVAALVEALKMMCEEFRGYDLPYGSKAYSQATAALARVKGEIK